MPPAFLQGAENRRLEEIPDSVLILHAYQAWGVDCLQRLNGVFAFAVWDGAAGRLFAARSPVIAPSLVYFASPRWLAFASMPAALHALPFIPRALNELALADTLAGIGDDPQNTLYHDILRLPTGHWLLAGDEGVKTGCYWRPDMQREIRYPHDDDYLQAFDELFTRVVADHLRSLTPVAVQMSGGLDSASVAVTAARLLAGRGQRLTTFTEAPQAGFSGALPKGYYADETPFVQAIAAAVPNLDLNLMHTDGRTFLQDLDLLFAHLEAPVRDASNRVWIEAILQAAQQRGMQVLLDGMQGNLTISWNGSGLIPSLLRAGKWGLAFHEARSLARGGVSHSALRALVGQGVLPLLPAPLWLALEWLRRPRAFSPRPWLTASAIHPAFAAAQRVEERARERNYLLRSHFPVHARQARAHALAREDGGAYLSAYRAMYGVDMRTPTADVRLCEFCLALPEEQFLRAGEPRSLIRRAMAGRLPAIVLANQHRGLQAADWFDRLVDARLQVVAELDRLEKSPLARQVLDLARLRSMLERLPAGAVDDYKTIAVYRTAFERGLVVGRFLCWFEDGG